MTLGVSDLARARSFYEEGLGWKGTGPDEGSVRFIQLGRLVLGLWSRKALAEDGSIRLPD